MSTLSITTTYLAYCIPDRTDIMTPGLAGVTAVTVSAHRAQSRHPQNLISQSVAIIEMFYLLPGSTIDWSIYNISMGQQSRTTVQCSFTTFSTQTGIMSNI